MEVAAGGGHVWAMVEVQERSVLSLLLEAKIISLCCQLSARPSLLGQEERDFLCHPHNAALDGTHGSISRIHSGIGSKGAAGSFLLKPGKWLQIHLP